MRHQSVLFLFTFAFVMAIVSSRGSTGNEKPARKDAAPSPPVTGNTKSLSEN